MTQRFPSTNVRTALQDAFDWFARLVGRWFEIDLRALAAFRISLGLLLIVDLVARSRSLGAFYTDSGVLPREALFSDYANVYSLHAISGAAWAQTVLFCIAGAFALALVVGYRTRIATIVSWLLLVSLHIRNPMILNSGDVLLRMLLFWGIFLPLDETWSVSAEHSERDSTTVASIATMALLLQVVFMYVTNTVHKFRGELWMDGEALVHIMSADQFTVLLGNTLAEYHSLLELINYLWIALILASPLLFVLTGRARTIFPTLFVGMHLGMLVTMRIGLFPLVVVAALLPFYPSVVWDAVSDLVSRAGITDALRSSKERFSARLPKPPVPATGINAPDVPNWSAVVGGGRTVFFTLIPYLMLALVVMSNAQAVDYGEVPDPGEQVLETTQADQSWRMFAPSPARTTRWFAAAGTLENGSEIDVLHKSRVDLERPENVESTYRSARWRKYLSNVQSASNENHRSYLANHLCDRWNRQHETGITNVTVYHVFERVDPYSGEREAYGRIQLIDYDCSGKFVQHH